MHTLALFSGQPGLPEILLILFIVLLLFGSRKLPDLARSLGRSLTEFKRGKDDALHPGAEEDEEPQDKDKA